jgi:competence protein ComEA
MIFFGNAQRRSGPFFAVAFALFIVSVMPLSRCQTTVQNSKSSASSPPPAANLLDINTASAAELRSLPGMGDAYSARVIAGRPYTAKNQLVQKGVIPQATYDKISSRIIAHRPK